MSKRCIWGYYAAAGIAGAAPAVFGMLAGFCAVREIWELAFACGMLATLSVWQNLRLYFAATDRIVAEMDAHLKTINRMEKFLSRMQKAAK